MAFSFFNEMNDQRYPSAWSLPASVGLEVEGSPACGGKSPVVLVQSAGHWEWGLSFQGDLEVWSVMFRVDRASS